jgi:hypothetical protein
MIEIHLTDQEIQDLNEAIDDPSHSEKTKIKLLVIRMRHEGAKTGFISKCLNLHGNTVTNYLNEFQSGKLPATLKPQSQFDRAGVEAYKEEVPDEQIPQRFQRFSD